jgi:hypothetical protein
MSSADCWMLVLLRGPQAIDGSGGFGRNHSRLVCVAPSRTVVVSGPYEAPGRVMRVCREEHVVRRPAVVEAVRPHARDAALRHLHHFGLGQEPPLVHGDRIQGLVVGAGAGGRVQVVRRLMQVVHDRRMPFEEEAVHVLRQLEHLPDVVAVVVVRDVLPPVHQRQARGTARQLLVEVVRVHLLLTSVHFDDWRDERDHVVADRLNEGRLLHSQTIRHFLEHLRAARFR